MQLRSALISVYSKDGLEPIIRRLHELGVVLYSTGGTQSYIQKLGIPVIGVDTLTGYPSILDGRVKPCTLPCLVACWPAANPTTWPSWSSTASPKSTV